ncbi:GIP [Symbiodinium natans]|uniref:GIP protein n=1 Tax=Symbiodinium natans TaxID=878477 RepID=A0A812QBK8_9DINO|nr:GIP [Symbiodinium natans]
MGQSPACGDQACCVKPCEAGDPADRPGEVIDVVEAVRISPSAPSIIGQAQRLQDALVEECVEAPDDEPEPSASNPHLPPPPKARLSVISADLPPPGLPYRLSFPDTNSSAHVSKLGSQVTDNTDVSKRRSQDTDGSKEVRRSVDMQQDAPTSSMVARWRERSDSRLARHMSRRYSAVDQEIVRAISLARTLQGCGSIWRYNPARLSPEDRMAIFNQSVPVDSFDVFLSHTWFTKGRWKVLTLMLQFGWKFVLSLWASAVIVAAVLCHIDVLPAPLSFQADVADFAGECPLGPWCLIFSFVASLTGLVIAPYGRSCKDAMCFLDVASIHQTDTDLMERGVYGIGGFLSISKELRILWSPPYLSRLWCVFELAAYRKVNPSGKITFAPLFVERTILMAVLCVYLANFCILAASASSGSQMLARAGYVAMFIPFALNVHSLRKNYRTKYQLLYDMEHFDLGNVGCSNHFDGEFIQAAITKWYGDQEAFAAFIQGPLRQELQATIGSTHVPLYGVLLFVTPTVSFSACKGTGHCVLLSFWFRDPSGFGTSSPAIGAIRTLRL